MSVADDGALVSMGDTSHVKRACRVVPPHVMRQFASHYCLSSMMEEDPFALKGQGKQSQRTKMCTFHSSNKLGCAW